MAGQSDTDSGEFYPDSDTGPSTRHVRWTEVVAEPHEEGEVEAPPEANIILIRYRLRVFLLGRGVGIEGLVLSVVCLDVDPA